MYQPTSGRFKIEQILHLKPGLKLDHHGKELEAKYATYNKNGSETDVYSMDFTLIPDKKEIGYEPSIRLKAMTMEEQLYVLSYFYENYEEFFEGGAMGFFNLK